ncbi:hypothetical protein [Cognatiyoonia sp. IB215446]|uniref:hypothetical protein n=1 Tax=Cognatiyoonia sp. IB215446 TaxID=3097355 RepID=UPI002A23D4E8|nr:hypothetical protein [Cognatiyoonia sp. IB215446]
MIANTKHPLVNDELVDKPGQLRVDELISFMEKAAYNYAHHGNSNTATALFIAVAALERHRA